MSEQWKWYVYIIECLDGTYYTGCTWNVANRLEQHLSGLGSRYTNEHGFKNWFITKSMMILKQREIVKNKSKTGAGKRNKS